MGIIDKCGVRGDATLCVVIFIYKSLWYAIISDYAKPGQKED